MFSVSSLLRRNLAWTLAGDAIYAACQWGMLIVLAKLGRPDMVGQFALGLAITAPVMILTNLSLRPIVATEHVGGSYFRDYLSLRLISSGLALALIIGIAVTAGYRQETLLIILVVGLAKAIEAISDIFYGLLQQHERMDRIATSMMLKGVLSLAALAISVASTGQALGGLIAMAMVWVVVLLTYDVPNGIAVLSAAGVQEGIRPRWDREALGNIARLAWPLGLTAMFVSATAFVPRYFVERYGGEEQLGIFAAMAYLMVAGSMVMNALCQTAIPRLARHYAGGERDSFRALLFKLVIVGSALGAAGLSLVLGFGGEVLNILYTPEYARHADVLVWIMVAAAIDYIGTCLSWGVTSTREFHHFSIPYFLVASLAVIASAILVPTHGLLGAAWVLCLLATAKSLVPVLIFYLIGNRKNV